MSVELSFPFQAYLPVHVGVGRMISGECCGLINAPPNDGNDYISACLSYQPPADAPFSPLPGKQGDLGSLLEFALFGGLPISRDDLVSFIGWLTAPLSAKTVALVEDVVLIGSTHSAMVNPG